MTVQSLSINQLSSQIEKTPSESDLSPLPPEDMMVTIGSKDREHFVRAMINRTTDIIEKCSVYPESSLLDIGCGSGRLAISFARYLAPSSRYIGFDVWPEGVSWCKENLASKHENLNFFLLNAEDNYYYQDERSGQSNDLSLPFVEDASIDCAFAISVFTHLTRDDAQQYFNELSRVLSPEGKAYLTFFIIDEHFHAYREKTGKYEPVKKEETDLWHAYSGQGFFSGYEHDTLKEMIEQSGLKIEQAILGKWAEKPGKDKTWQDLYIISK